MKSVSLTLIFLLTLVVLFICCNALEVKYFSSNSNNQIFYFISLKTHQSLKDQQKQELAELGRMGGR